jgi:tRNA1(Val) A37 N6-methylase TrmN6
LRYLDNEYFLSKKVLDIGCGEGILALEVAIRMFPAKIVALDIDSKMLIRAKRNADRFVEMNQKFESIKKNELVMMKLHDLPLYFQQKLQKSDSKFDLRSSNSL